MNKKKWKFFSTVARKFNIGARTFFVSIRQIMAKMHGQSFYCVNLSATESTETMGIVINSDLTVSCNSDDHYGNGKIGYLKNNSIHEILKDTVASDYRKKLAAGYLPIPECSNCPSLREINKKEAQNYVQPEVKEIANIMLEQTATCNIDCLSCNRDALYKNRTKRFIDIKDIENISKQFYLNKVKNIYYLNLGEPFVSHNILKVMKVLRENNPVINIVTSTNGLFTGQRVKTPSSITLQYNLCHLAWY